MLEEREDSKYEFGGVTGMKEDIKELPPRLEYEGNGTYYTIITVKLEKMRMSSFKGRNIENSINKLNRYFDNIFENVHYFDGAQAAVFRPGSLRSDGSMLADVVLTFTEWTDDFRVDLTKPSILGKLSAALQISLLFLMFYQDQIKTSLADYTETVSIENYPQFQEMENAFVVIFPIMTFLGLIFPAYVTFKRESGHR